MGLKNYILHLSDFFPPTYGEIKGVCALCHRKTEKGHKLKFSDNFTAWNLLGAGDCICEYCYTLISDQSYRRKSWIASLDGVRFLKRTEILPTLLNPPIPFATYITKSGKKQGFLLLMNRVNYSKKQFFIAFEDTLIFVDKNTLIDMVETAKTARELKFSKSDLLNPSVKRWEYGELCKKILRFSKKPLWEVVVFAID